MLIAYGLSKEIVIVMIHKSIRKLDRSPDGDTDFFEIVAIVLLWNT